MKRDAISTMLEEIKILSKQLNNVSKEALVADLGATIDYLININSATFKTNVDITKEVLGDQYRVEFVEDSDANQWLILPLQFPSISKIEYGKAFIKDSPVEVEVTYELIVSGPTEELAWLSLCNRHI